MRSNLSLWSASIPFAIVLVGVGLALEPSKASLALYVASILCAGARIVRFVVNEVAPADMCADDRLAPDEQPVIETTRPVRP